MSFEQLRGDLADLADEVNPVDLRDRALATSRKMGVRRATVMTTSAAAVMLVVAGALLVTFAPRHVASPATSTPTPAVSSIETSPSATPSTTPSTQSTPTTTSTSPAQSATVRMTGAPLQFDSRTKKIVGGTITMPVWPGLGGNCRAGTFHFVNGAAALTKGSDPNTYNMLYENNPLSYFRSRVVYGNFDGESTDEALVTVGCNGDGSLDATELLAVRIMSDGSVHTLGFVIPAIHNEPMDFDNLSVTVTDGTVAVQVTGGHLSNGGPAEAKQVRSYRYVDGSFRQVGGPTVFPSHPTDMSHVDLRTATIAFGLANCGSGCTSYTPVLMSDGRGSQDYVVKLSNGSSVIQHVTFTIRHSVIITGSDGGHEALVWVSETGSGASTSAAIYDVSLGNGNGWIPADLVTAVGQDGITGIVGIDGGPNLAKVTVKTATGQHIDDYARDSNGLWKLKK